MFQASIFLFSLPAQSTKLSIHTCIIQSLPAMQPTQLKSVVHVAKSEQRFHHYAWIVFQAWVLYYPTAKILNTSVSTLCEDELVH
jgi:hypothetical protein